MSAMPVEKPTSDCPACGHHTLVEHCDACSWIQCRNKDTCDLMFDARTGRGHKLDAPKPGAVTVRRIRWARGPRL